MTNTSVEIERLSHRRAELWANPLKAAPGEVARIAKRIADLYETRRIERAQDRGLSRAEIVRRARVETELERLIAN